MPAREAVAAGKTIAIKVSGWLIHRNEVVAPGSQCQIVWANAVREGVARAQSKGVHCGRPRRSFPCPQALQLQKDGLSIRDIAVKIGFPASTVGTALKAGSGSCVKSGGDKTGRSAPACAVGKRSQRVRGARPRRAFPIYEAEQLRAQGFSIRAVAAKIGFPASTVAGALKAHSLDKARRLAAKIERVTRASLKRAELTKANPSKDGGPPELKADPEPPADQAIWKAVEKAFNTRTEPNQ